MSGTQDPLRFAKLFATMKHEGQKYGVLPYTHHLQDVERVLREFGVEDLDLLTGAWLHDILEDTDTKVKEVQEVFGDRVADLVRAVTDEPGENRKARKAATYPKIRSVPDAILIKLADRIANVRNAKVGGRLIDMYRKEHEDFRRGLFTQSDEPGDPVMRMWDELKYLLAT